MFAISKSPQGYASAAFSVQHRGKKSGCHFCELAALERRWRWKEGGGRDDATSRARAVGPGGPFRGLVAGIARTSADVPRCHFTSTEE